MFTANSILVSSFAQRQRMLGMSLDLLAELSGISVPTLKRIFNGQGASLANVAAVAQALGFAITLDETEDADTMRERQAMAKAERLARLVQGTSALEGQALDDESFQRLVRKTYHELLAGSNRRLWSA